MMCSPPGGRTRTTLEPLSIAHDRPALALTCLGGARMSVARAELVDYLPAGRTRALIRHGDEYVLLVRKGSPDAQQTCDEMTELLQAMLDGGDDPEWPPPPADPSAN